MTRRGAAAALLCFAIAVGVRGRAADAANVSSSPDDSLTPVVTRDGDTVVVAWIESQPTQDGLRATIFAARSSDGGRAFDAPVSVAPLAGYATGLQVHANTGRVHLAWLVTSYTTGSPAGVAYARSTDGGATYEAARVVNASAFPGSPELAASGDRVAVVWSTNAAVWAAVSADGGATVSDPARVDDGGDVVDGSARASLGDADMGVVWVSGAERALWFRAVDVSTAPGSKAARRLSAPGDRAAEPDLEAAGPAFAAAWSDGAGGVYGAWSADGGASFVELPRVERTSKIAMPRVAISGTAAYRVWLDRSARLVYRRDVANATAPAIVGTLGRRAVFPDVSAAGEVVCVVWQTRSGRAARLFSRVSGDAGATFGPAAALSDRGEFAAAARASAGDGRAAAVWQMPVAGRQDVFFASLAP